MIKGMVKFFKVWARGFAISMGEEMAYKTSFILLMVSMTFNDLIGPLVSIAIYTVSSGIPGWTLAEFILLQGIGIFIFGIWHAFIGGISWATADYTAEGEFDMPLVKPFPTAALMAVKGIDFHGITEVIVGLLIMTWAIVKLDLVGIMLLPFAFVILMGLVFILSISLIIAALSIIFIRVYAMQNIIDVFSTIASYPINIYSSSVRFFLTFIIPAAIAGYWPAAILTGKEAISSIWIIVVPIAIFFMASLWFWSFALKRYQSAGG